MGKIKDLTGQRFGRLVVISYSHVDKHGKACWNTVCDCGNVSLVSSNNLCSGKTKSCGCLRKKYKDISGKRFGRLVAVEPTDKRKGTSIIWKCLCDCKKTTFVASDNLVGGNTKSCGCLSIESAKARIGPLHHRWNPKKTDEERTQRRSIPGYEEWRAAVYKRDNYICQKCGDSTGGNLNAHHIESYADNKELRTELSNGVTLCKKCHDEFHHIYGYDHVSGEKFVEWMNNSETEEL